MKYSASDGAKLIYFWYPFVLTKTSIWANEHEFQVLNSTTHIKLVIT